MARRKKGPESADDLSGVFNTLAPRTEKIKKKDLNAVRGRLTVAFAYAAGGERGDACEFWNGAIPLTPQQAVDVLTGDLPEGTKASINQVRVSDGSGKISVSDGAFDFDTDFDLKKKTGDAGSYTVDDKKQDRKIGRTVVRNKIEFLHACGVKRLEIYAASTHGGYVWARLGFLPEKVTHSSFQSDVGDYARERYFAIRHLLPESERKTMDRATKLKRRKDLWAVADCRFDLKNVVLKEDRGMKWDSDLVARARQGQAIPAGFYMLAGSRWSGVMNLNDGQQMKRVGEYVGGWRHLRV